MAATNVSPNLTNNPALVRALIALLVSQPGRPTITIAAARQEFTRAACRRAIAQAMREYATTNPALVDEHPDLADFTKYADEQAFLKDAWLAVNEYIVSQQPEGNLPTRQQLEYWMNRMELDRLERLATNPDKTNPWTAENLTLERMQQLWDAARRWDEARMGVQQGAMTALVQDLSPEAQPLAIQSQDLAAIADISAQAVTQEAAADIQVGTRLDPTTTQRIAGTAGHSTHPASTATTIATATASGRSTFRQGVTEVLTQTPASQEAYQFTQRVKDIAGVDDQQAVVIRNAFEDAVERGRDQQTALRESLRASGFSPREADRITAANRTVAQDYHQFVNDVGNTTEQWKQAVRARQTLTRATAPSARQLVRTIQAVAGVNQEEAIETLVTIEHEVAQNQPYQAALAEGLAQLNLEPDKTQTAYNSLAAAVEDHIEATESLRAQPLSAEAAQPIAQRFTQQIQAVSGATSEQAAEVRGQFEAGLAQGKSPDRALTESLQVLSLPPDQTQTLTQQLTGPARLYEQFVQSGKTQTPVALASPEAQEQFVQYLTSSTNISRNQALQISQHFEQAVRLGHTPQAALRNSLRSFEFSPNQLEQLSRGLAPFVQEYAGLVQAAPLSQAGLGSSPTAIVPVTTLVSLNNQSLTENGPVINHSTLELHQLGVRSDTLSRILAQSPHYADFNPEFLEQTRTALSWLEQHPELMRDLGIETPSAPLRSYILEMDARPWNSREYFRRRFEQLNLQLAAKNAQGSDGWLKAPKLKWQAGWLKFVADHPHLAGIVGFTSSPKSFVKHKVGGWLAGRGMRWLTKSAAGKAIGSLATKIGAKLASKGLAKLIGGAIGTLIGGPLGTFIGMALGFVLEKVGGWLRRNLRKIALILGGLLALLIGLIAKAAAMLPALLTGLGIWLLPTPFGIPLLAIGLAGLAHQIGSWIGKGGLSGAAKGIASGIGDFLGLSTTAAAPAYVTAAPLVAIGSLVVINVFTTMSLTSAFMLLPSEGQKLETADCTSGAHPLPGSNTASNPIARRAWDIVSNLQQGFWCYWNYSPDNPDLFNQSMYQANPFPSYPGPIDSCSNCLFWCTWLVQKAYGGGAPTALSSQALMNDWPNPLIDASSATPENIKPGSVIFFKVSGGRAGVNHVAIVYSVSEDSVVYVQANSPAKMGSLTFNGSGVGVQSPPGILVVNFGTP